MDTGRLRPPRARAGLIARPRLEAAASRRRDISVIALQADAGYGKTTAADMLTRDGPRIWYALSAEDRDPLVFAAHLLAGLAQLQPDVVVPVSTDEPWPVLLETFQSAFDIVDGDVAHLVLDDYHLVHDSPVDELVGRLTDRMPQGLRLVITSREHIGLSGWVAGRARGDVLDVGVDALAFDAEETAAYCATQHGLSISDADAALLTEETEGWPIGLSLLAQRLDDEQSGPEAVLAALPEGRTRVFDFLREEVLRAQPADVRRFLLAIAVLDHLGPDAAAAVTGLSVAQATERLEALVAGGVFCATDGTGAYRLHHLFREFLWAQLDTAHQQELHVRAAAHRRQTGAREQAARHEADAGRLAAAARDVLAVSQQLLDDGRHHSLLNLTDPLDRVLDDFPALRVARSHALRRVSRFTEALAEARAARTGGDRDPATDVHALVAETMVFLDTVQPAAAERTLAEVGRDDVTHDVVGQAVLDRMAAENLVNAGQLDDAEQLLDTTGTDEHSDIRLRLLVRRGDLQRARAAMRPDTADPGPGIPRAHREDAALRSWIHGLRGATSRAARDARDGIALGQRLQSPIISCVCRGRLGLAQLCDPHASLGETQASFRASLAIADQIQVERFRAEPLIGLTLLAAAEGDLGDAKRHAREAIDLLDAAGDTYLGAMARLALGIALAVQGHPDAGRHLHDAAARARHCGDRLVPMVADQWLAHLALHSDDTDGFHRHATAALAATADLALEELWRTPGWLSLPRVEDRRIWLDAAAELPDVGALAAHLRDRLGDDDAASITGGESGETIPTLRLRTLGGFEVLRGGEPLPRTAWRRRTALEILWLLIITDRHEITREKAMDVLWPGEAGDAVNGRLRVGLHALHLALEPDREPGTPPRYVVSHGDRLCLDPDLVTVDVDEYRTAASNALDHRTDEPLVDALHAIDLYDGPFLDDEPYVEWLAATRETLAATFRTLTVDTARQLLHAGESGHAAALARRAIASDPYLESAHELLALAHRADGDDVLARRVYEDCRTLLQEDLGVEPVWSLPGS